MGIGAVLVGGRSEPRTVGLSTWVPIVALTATMNAAYGFSHGRWPPTRPATRSAGLGGMGIMYLIYNDTNLFVVPGFRAARLPELRMPRRRHLLRGPVLCGAWARRHFLVERRSTVPFRKRFRGSEQVSHVCPNLFLSRGSRSAN